MPLSKEEKPFSFCSFNMPQMLFIYQLCRAPAKVPSQCSGRLLQIIWKVYVAFVAQQIYFNSFIFPSKALATI